MWQQGTLSGKLPIPRSSKPRHQPCITNQCEHSQRGWSRCIILGLWGCTLPYPLSIFSILFTFVNISLHRLWGCVGISGRSNDSVITSRRYRGNPHIHLAPIYIITYIISRLSINSAWLLSNILMHLPSMPLSCDRSSNTGGLHLRGWPTVSLLTEH